ncbi:hypothetical protein DFJ77DRAFT_441777 [Powellomyces hirtus]|nr:hypothetical protein DFJ77DRAFT_441777 [Powellomyces hirtus]
MTGMVATSQGSPKESTRSSRLSILPMLTSLPVRSLLAADSFWRWSENTQADDGSSAMQKALQMIIPGWQSLTISKKDAAEVTGISRRYRISGVCSHCYYYAAAFKLAQSKKRSQAFQNNGRRDSCKPAWTWTCTNGHNIVDFSHIVSLMDAADCAGDMARGEERWIWIMSSNSTERNNRRHPSVSGGTVNGYFGIGWISPMP